MVSTYFNFKIRPSALYRTAIVYNPISLNHTRPGEPESALRIQAILKELKSQNMWSQVNHIEARKATEDEIQLVHDKEYISSVKRSGNTQKNNYLNHDKWSPYGSKYVYESALTAVGGLIDLSEAVARKEFENGFAIVRPPGHHALRNKAMGYCVFNNIAIATKNLLNKKLARKILIFDIDAHHGNGLEDVFKNSTEVFYVSLHQKWIFPYSGDQNTANIRNLNLKFLETEENYKKEFEIALAETVESFKPDFIFVSAGYDAHWRDYMSNLGLSSLGHAWLSEKLVAAAARYSDNKIVFSLEGGYDLEALSLGVTNSIKALMHRNDFTDPIGPAPQN